MYSMRSYETGDYSILKDGNFKLQLNRMNWDKDYLVVPHNISDLDEFLDLGIIPSSQLIFGNYGENAYDTRKNFWINNDINFEALGFDVVTDITGFPYKNKFVNNFNITKDPNHSRWYIDEFIQTDLESIDRGEKTYVLNQCQKDYLVELAPELEDKIIVNQKVIRKEYFDIVGTKVPDLDFHFDIFFPFRVSDPAYKFIEVVQNNPEKTILITDPNDSYTEIYSNIIKKRFTKAEYYGIISTRPKIIYNEDPNKVFHPGLADFIYFGCDVVCPYNVPTLEDVLI
jgi:hypothetical protein